MLGSVSTAPSWHGLWLRLIEDTTPARGALASALVTHTDHARGPFLVRSRRHAHVHPRRAIRLSAGAPRHVSSLSTTLSRFQWGWQGSAKKPDCGSLKIPGLSRHLLSYCKATLKSADERPLVEVEKELQLAWDHRSTPEAQGSGPPVSIWRADSRSALPLPRLLSPGARRPHVDLSVPEAHAQ